MSGVTAFPTQPKIVSPRPPWLAPPRANQRIVGFTHPRDRNRDIKAVFSVLHLRFLRGADKEAARAVWPADPGGCVTRSYSSLVYSKTRGAGPPPPPPGRPYRQPLVGGREGAGGAVLERFRVLLARVGLEARPLSPWLHTHLRKAGLATICVETRHVKAALGAMRNKP